MRTASSASASTRSRAGSICRRPTARNARWPPAGSRLRRQAMPEMRPNDADRRWAAEQAPRLLAEARAEALQETHARLRGMLLDALMAAAMAGGDEPSPRV